MRLQNKTISKHSLFFELVLKNMFEQKELVFFHQFIKHEGVPTMTILSQLFDETGRIFLKIFNRTINKARFYVMFFLHLLKHDHLTFIYFKTRFFTLVEIMKFKERNQCKSESKILNINEIKYNLQAVHTSDIIRDPKSS